MTKKKFLRYGSDRFKRIGRKNKWRRARGRDNKIRENIKGHIHKPCIGFKKSRKKKEISIIRNLKDLEQTKEKEIIIAKIGSKKRKEIEKKAEEMGIKILNKKKKQI